VLRQARNFLARVSVEQARKVSVKRARGKKNVARVTGGGGRSVLSWESNWGKGGGGFSAAKKGKRNVERESEAAENGLFQSTT